MLQDFHFCFFLLETSEAIFFLWWTKMEMNFYQTRSSFWQRRIASFLGKENLETFLQIIPSIANIFLGYSLWLFFFFHLLLWWIKVTESKEREEREKETFEGSIQSKLNSIEFSLPFFKTKSNKCETFGFLKKLPFD